MSTFKKVEVSVIKLVILFLIIMLQSCNDSRRTEVDLILSNSTLYTLDSLNTKAESVAVLDGKIVAVGSDEEIAKHYKSSRTIDGRGLFIYPGFIDAHSHFTGFAEYLRYADLGKAESFIDLLSIIREFHKLHPKRWIVGRGWDQNKWKDHQFPESNEIDRLFPDIPVVLTRIDGHAVLANKAALREAGLLEPFPPGEAIMKNGKPTGIFLEHTADRIKQAIPPPSSKEMDELIVEAASLCQAAGLTGVNDAGIDKSMILLIDSMQKSGKLRLRVDAMINPNEENMNYFMNGRDYSTDFLRVGSIKIYADGALGSRGACLLQPYTDQPSSNGILVTSEQEVRRICSRAYQQSFQVNTHAIGDSAVRMVLHVYSEFLKGKNDRRWRIEHAQVVNENDFNLFGKFSVIPSVQATHATSDMTWAETRLGSERVKNAYAYRRLMEQSGWIANGTDFPVEDISPVRTFYAAVSRKDLEGNPPGGFQAENKLSRIDALRSITIWAARAAFQELKRGSIEEGKFADFVILDKDLMSVPEKEIPATKVKYTIINGEIVYSDKAN
jgi:predicted amidohydrolase YtcJ